MSPLFDDDQRLEALRRYQILDTLPEEDYNDLVELASAICQTPTALITLVDTDRQWFKAKYGFDLTETPRVDSFCAHALPDPTQLLLVEDARTDERFAYNPLVTGDPHIVFYAGSPLVDKEGYALGTLCVIDQQPRQLNPMQLKALRTLAKQVVRLLELHRTAQELAEKQAQLQAEKLVLESSQRRFQTIFDHAPIGLGLLSGADHTFELVNDRIARMAGRRVDQMQGKPLLEALPELAQQGLKEIFDTVRNTGQRFVAPEIPVRLQRNHDLETAYFYASFEPVAEPDGSVSIVDFSLDITEQILSQRALKESENQLRQIIDQAPMAIGQLQGREMVIQLGNDKIFEVWGKDASVVGKRLIEALPELKGQPFIDILETVYDTGHPFYGNSVLAKLVRKGQLEDVYFDFSYTPIRNATGTITGIMIMANEVTEQVLIRQKIERSEARFRSFVEEAPFATAVYESPDLLITLANPNMIKLWGKTPAVVGLPLEQALPELEGQPFIPLLKLVYSTGQAYRTTEQVAELVVDGKRQTYWFNFVYQPLFDANGTVYGILNMAVDVTEKVQARQLIEEREAQYQELNRHLEERVAQRTEELRRANQDLQRSNDNLRQFAQVASHHLQEPLRKVQAFSTLLSQQYQRQLDEKAQTYLARIESAGSRMSLLLKDLLNYSQVAPLQQRFGNTALTNVLALVLEDLSTELTNRQAQVRVAELPIINGDEEQLMRLFSHLLINALKFTPEEEPPQIQVQYFRRTPDELPKQVQPTQRASMYHQISISDEGIGFDNKYIDRIFDIFQRLHNPEEYSGTGIGLAICQRVVENHGGGITADSKPGEGATFCLYFPAYGDTEN